jgi:putative phosphoribosyl transferase
MNNTGHTGTVKAHEIQIPADDVTLEGELRTPAGAKGIVLFAHGSGSSRHSPRNQFVARTIRERNVGTLLFDLLTSDEEAEDFHTGYLRFNINLLARRLIAVSEWVKREQQHLRIGYFGSSTGGGAALVAAAALGAEIGAVVSRGGRPDLAGDSLLRVESPTLLIVGGNDEPVISLNERAYALLHCKKELRIIPGATHLFEEPGALEEVARQSSEWFEMHLQPR